MLWGVALLEALVVDEVALLLHVVGHKDVGHEDGLATRLVLLLLQLLLSALGHFLLGFCVKAALLVQVVAFALSEERLLLYVQTLLHFIF